MFFFPMLLPSCRIRDERFRIAVKTLSFMGVSGLLQNESKVVHIVAESIWQPKFDADPIAGKSRDFR